MGPQLGLWRESHLWGEMGVCAGGRGHFQHPHCLTKSSGSVEAALALRCFPPLSEFTLRR